MITPTRKTMAAAGAVAASFGGGAYAVAASTSSSKEAALTGGVTDKVRTAALGKVPGGTLVGVESERGGGYEAQVRKPDGTYVGVKLSKRLAVTSVQSRPSVEGGRHGRGGAGHVPDTAALAKDLGVSQAKLKSALRAVRPDRTREDRDNEIVATLARSLGTTPAKVRSVLSARGGERGAHGPGPEVRDGRAGMAAALAKAAGVSRAKAQKALDDARPGPGERFDELASALAKELGVSKAKVKAALQKSAPAESTPRERGHGEVQG